jgi:Glycosyltransferase family 87
MRKGVSRRSAVTAVLATAAVVYMCVQAHGDGVAIARGGFGSDFHGTIWNAGRAVLHGLSPYPDPSKPLSVPTVYLPPILVATAPLAWLSLHAATWVWFALLLAAALGVLVALGVRDPWCYLLFSASLPVTQALVLGNASILVALGVALAWRFRDRPIGAPLAVAATVAVKFVFWPLIVWLLIVRPRAGIRSAAMLAALTLAAWAVIELHGLRRYPALIHAEGSHFAYQGSLLVAALVQAHVRIRYAAAAGVIGSLALLGLAWFRRAAELEVFSLALLASLVGTTVGWPHYLVVMAIPIVILYPRISWPWAWFPALWAATHLGAKPGQVTYSLIFCLFAALPVALVFVSSPGRRRVGAM